MMYLDFPTVAFNIEAHVGFALAVRGIQLGDHLLWLYTRVLREHSDRQEYRLKITVKLLYSIHVPKDV